MTLPAFFVSARNLLSEILTSWGRGVDDSTFYTYTTEANPDPVEQNDLDTYHDLSLNAWVYAGIQKRIIGLSRLWTGAGPIGDPEKKDEPYSDPQVIFPHNVDGNEEQLEFIRWLCDVRIQGGIASVLQNILYSQITYGRAVLEIMYEYQEGGVYNGKVVIAAMNDCDPQRFVINPPYLPLGVYLKPDIYSDSVSLQDRQPDLKFWVVPKGSHFKNPYGEATIRPLTRDDGKGAVYQSEQIELEWGKGLEKAGSGAYLARYDNTLRGKDSDAKRLELITQLQDLKNNTISIMYQGHELEVIKADVENQGFLDYLTYQVSKISTVLTGSSQTLLQSETGSYAKAESMDVREHGNKEQDDAANIQAAFETPFMWILGLNYTDIPAIPKMQIIPPDLIQPTISEKEEEAIDSQEQDDPEPIAPIEQAALLLQEEGEDPGSEAPEGFPDNTPLPEFYVDIEQEAKDFLNEMQTVSYQDYLDLPEGVQNTHFTIKRLQLRQNAVQLIDALKGEIAKSIGAGSEDEAWQGYITKARGIFEQFVGRQPAKYEERELMVSFRMARANAYAGATKQLAADNPGQFHGFMLDGPVDSRARLTHKVWVGFVAPVDDDIWNRITPPLDFNCRHFLVPITKLQYEQDPEKYRYTPESERPIIFPGETFKRY